MRRLLPYQPDLGHRLRQQASANSKAIWMRIPGSDQELFTAHPHDFIQLSYQQDSDDRKCYTSDTNAFWQRLDELLTRIKPQAGLEDIPFRGGLAGFIGYGGCPDKPSTPIGFPKAFMGLYTHFIHIDHYRQTAEEIVLEAYPHADAWQLLVSKTVSTVIASTPFSLSSPFEALTPKALYTKHFHQIQKYLKEGDCYQVNYTQAFRAHCQGSSAQAMQRLLSVSNPAYAAWLSLPEGDVLSLSPELFLEVKNHRILTRPIKGTAPRHDDPEEDARQAERLGASTKNRAENLMIVDLLRHDIGRHAKTGSVQVEKLFEIESLPQVHHLVSTISAELKSESAIIDLIRDCLPGGSITGAPKKRAMEIITELEPTPRSVYCGSIGFINADGDCQLNIAIRTLLRLENDIYTWAGGGIVADSDCEDEYQECFDKIGALMRTLESMG